MKKFIILFMTFMALVPVPDSFGKDTSTTLLLKDTNVDPRLPVSSTISCVYSAGVLTFSLPSEIQFATVLITSETGELWSGMVTQDYPSVEISELPGDQTITLIDDNGIEYTGDISFE